MTPPHLLAFTQSVSLELAMDIVTTIQAGSQQAWADGSDLHPGAARDLYPHRRRALIQHGLLEAGARHARHGVQTIERLNVTGNSSHVELVVGTVVLIPAAVETARTPVREAVYRTSLVTDPQVPLPSLGPISPTIPGDAVVAAILYGPSSSYPRGTSEVIPSFIVVRFPTANWESYAEGSLDLLGRWRAREKGYDSAGPQLRRQSDMA